MNFICEVKYENNLLDNIKRLVAENKVVVIRDLPESIDINSFYTNIGQILGLLFKKDVDPINKKIIHDSWTTIRYDERYINQTYKHSNKHQPLHTDYCNASINLDLVLLVCETAATYGGATVFWDAIDLVSLLEEYQPILYSAIQKYDVIFGKTPSPIFQNKAKILSFDKKGPLVNWNYAVISDDNSPEVLELCNQFHCFLEENVFLSGCLKKVNLKRGDAVVFNDKRILHGRNSFLGYRSLLKAGIATENHEYIMQILQDVQF